MSRFRFLIIIIILLIGLRNSFTFSQVRFQNIYQAGWDDYGWATCSTAEKDFIIGGNTSSFGNGIDIFFLKIDSIGNVIWGKSLGGSGNDDLKRIKATSDGGFIAGGCYAFSTSNTDALVLKFNSSGNLQWNRLLNCGNFEIVTDLVETSDGGYIIVGGGGVPSSDQKLFAAKLTNSGSVTWFKRFNYGTCTGSGVKQTSDGGFIISGGTGTPTMDYLLMKLDSNGNINWAKSYGGSSNEVSYEINLVPGGGYLITGDSWSFHYGNQDLWLIKTDQNGNIIWNRTYGESNKAFRCSNTYVNYDGSAITACSDQSSSNADAYLVKTGANGNLLWVKNYGGSANDVNTRILKTSDNGYFSIGYSNCFGTGYDIYTLKCDSVGFVNLFNCYQAIPTFGTTTPTITPGNPSISSTNLTTYSTLSFTVNSRTFSQIKLCLRPEARFSADKNRICQSNVINFYDSTLYNPINWKWTFTGGTPSVSYSRNPTNIRYNTAGTFPVTLIATNIYGTDTITKTSYITVMPNVSTAFTINDSTQCLHTNNFIFNNNSSITQGNFSNLWRFGNGDTIHALHPTYSYTIPDTYTVKLITKSDSGCLDSVFKNVYVFNEPEAFFSVNDSIHCLNNNKFIFTNSSYSPGGSYTSYWDFNDSSTSNSVNPTHNYNKSGIYIIKLRIASSQNCIDSFSRFVNILPSPFASFLINDSTQCLKSNNFIFTSNSTISSGSISHHWIFGNGDSSLSVNPVYSFSGEGTYRIKLILFSDSGCFDSISSNVYIYPDPKSNFLVNDSNQCLKSNKFHFTNNSYVNSGSIISLWDFGDSTFSTIINPQHSYTNFGLFETKLMTITNFGCRDSFIKKNRIWDSPVASFNINDSFQCLSINQAIFSNTSHINQGNFNSKWFFGDGDSSEIFNPVHSYKYSDTFSTMLIITSDSLCFDTSEKRIYILNNPPNIVLSSNSPICEGDSLLISLNTFQGATYHWTGSNGFSSSADHIILTSISLKDSGLYSVVRSKNGCNSDSSSIKVIVKPRPDTSLLHISLTSPVCEGDSLILHADNIPGYLYYWSGPFGFNSQLNEIIKYPVLLIDSGLYDLTLDYNGCRTQPMYLKASIKNRPIATAGNNSPLCEGDSLFLFANLLIGANYFWYSTDGFTSKMQNPTIYPAQLKDSGIYILSISYNSCISKPSMTYVKINKTPDTPIVTGIFNLCVEDDLHFNTDDVIGGTFSWTGPMGFTSKTQSPIISNIQTQRSGIYSVKVTVNKCQSAPSRIKVSVFDNPTVYLGNDTNTCEGNKIALDPGYFFDYLWEDSSKSRIHFLNKPGTYWVKVFNSSGCSNSDSIIVSELCPPSIYIPNAFTPNNDGINDSFIIKGKNIIDFSIKIFDRWGEEIFHSFDVNNGWDGTYRGINCPIGTYYWTLSYRSYWQNHYIYNTKYGKVVLLR